MIADCQLENTIKWVNEHAEELQVPVLLIHGATDEVVPVASTTSFYERIASNKKLRLYKDNLHRTFDDLEKDQVLTHVAQWLTSTIK